MDEGLQQRLRGRVDGKVAIVTGGGTTEMEDPVTFGYAIASCLAAGGARVVVLDREPEAAERSVARITARGADAVAVVADITSREDCDAAVADVVGREGRVDILVNNAAIIGTGWTIDADDDAYLRTMDINWMGAVRMARAAIPSMPSGSSIVNIASIGTNHDFGMLDYSSSKGALLSLTYAMAVHHGPSGIRVNSVSPGTMFAQIGARRLEMAGASADEIAEQRRLRAESVPLRSEGSGWDIALAVLYLASEESRWVSGQDLVVDAGLGRMGWSNSSQK
jgi:NAD(P)-dependent dehydrogenase (short-subunit alcohol dehydrogenase family)